MNGLAICSRNVLIGRELPSRSFPLVRIHVAGFLAASQSQERLRQRDGLDVELSAGRTQAEDGGRLDDGVAPVQHDHLTRSRKGGFYYGRRALARKLPSPFCLLHFEGDMRVHAVLDDLVVRDHRLEVLDPNRFDLLDGPGRAQTGCAASSVWTRATAELKRSRCGGARTDDPSR